MPKLFACKPAGQTRLQGKTPKNKVKIQLDCQLFTRTICPEMQETACFMKDC